MRFEIWIVFCWMFEVLEKRDENFLLKLLFFFIPYMHNTNTIITLCQMTNIFFSKFFLLYISERRKMKNEDGNLYLFRKWEWITKYCVYLVSFQFNLFSSHIVLVNVMNFYMKKIKWKKFQFHSLKCISHMKERKITIDNIKN